MDKKKPQGYGGYYLSSMEEYWKIIWEKFLRVGGSVKRLLSLIICFIWACSPYTDELGSLGIIFYDQRN